MIRNNRDNRSRRARVHITLDVETVGAEKEKELPFVVGVLGDFSGDKLGQSKPVRDRKFIHIDRDNFDQVLEGINPNLNLKVDNTLLDDGSEMVVNLKFQSMADFSPEKIIEQVEPLHKLLKVRQKLTELISKADLSEKLAGYLDEALQNSEQIQQLSEELHIDNKEDKDNKKKKVNKGDSTNLDNKYHGKT